MRARSFSCPLFALILGGLLACSDITAPTEGAFQVTVSPDTVSKTGPAAGAARVTLRNTSRVDVRIDWCNVALEREVSPGVWPAPDPPTVACVTEALAAQSQQTVFRSVGTLPGRFRFAYRYWFSSSVAGQNASGPFTVYSNAFVVAP
jgi:hypothetical protein